MQPCTKSQWFWKSWKNACISGSWLSLQSTHRKAQHYQATRRWRGLPLESHLRLFAFKDGHRLWLEITQASHSPVCSCLKRSDFIPAYRWSDLNWLWPWRIVPTSLRPRAAIPELCWGRMVHSSEEHLGRGRSLVCFGHLGLVICHLCFLLKAVFYCYQHRNLSSNLSSMAQSIQIRDSPTGLGQSHPYRFCSKVWHHFHCANGMLCFWGLGALG